MKSMIHTGLLRGMSNFFQKRCSIQDSRTITDPDEGFKEVWVSRAGYVNIPCTTGQIRQVLSKAGEQFSAVNTEAILLKGYYQNIRTTDRVFLDGVYYTITSIAHDSQDRITELLIQRIL